MKNIGFNYQYMYGVLLLPVIGTCSFSWNIFIFRNFSRKPIFTYKYMYFNLRLYGIYRLACIVASFYCWICWCIIHIITHPVRVTRHVGKRSSVCSGIMKLMTLEQPVKTSLRSVFSWLFSVINFIIPSKLNINTFYESF